MLLFSVTSFRAISPLYFLQDPAGGPQGVPAPPELGGLRPFPRHKYQRPGRGPFPARPSVYNNVTVTASLGRAIKRARQVTVSTGS